MGFLNSKISFKDFVAWWILDVYVIFVYVFVYYLHSVHKRRLFEQVCVNALALILYVGHILYYQGYPLCLLAICCQIGSILVSYFTTKFTVYATVRCYEWLRKRFPSERKKHECKYCKVNFAERSVNVPPDQETVEGIEMVDLKKTKNDEPQPGPSGLQTQPGPSGLRSQSDSDSS